MSTYEYTVDIKHEDTVLIYDFDVEVDIEGIDREGYPRILDIRPPNGLSLLKYGRLGAELFERVHDTLMGNSDFIQMVADEEGFEYHGLGGNDPDGYWQKRK